MVTTVTVNGLSVALRTLLTGAALAIVMGSTPICAAAAPATPAMTAPQFRATMRKLWEDHITWTRLYIVSAAANLPDTGPTLHRLLQNQVDIGGAIEPFYGTAAVAKLTALLTEHILGSGALLAAAKAGDQSKVQAASAAWYTNADDIAVFLSGANPEAWPLDQMKAGMKMHLDLTLAEVTARLQGDFAADIEDYDKVHEHILKLADLLSAGIISQFPNKFVSSAAGN